jgi:hypothetical protein
VAGAINGLVCAGLAAGCMFYRRGNITELPG